MNAIASPPPDTSLASIAHAVRSRQVTAVSMAEEALNRIARLDPALHAFCTLDEAGALAAARQVDARIARGEAVGPLAGVPVAVKDLICTRGLRTTFGSRLYKDHVPDEDDVVVERLRAAGALIVGKTNTSEFGYGAFGHNPLFPTTRNPWNPDLTPGGSSAGAGAATAAGYGPLHLGTDIGGSLRLPASWCGIFTLKPSLGRIPIDPPYMGRAAGPMTRTVADAALAMQVLSRPDARDSMNLPPQDIDWGSVAGTAPEHLRGLRFGLLLDAGCGLAVEPEVRAAVEQAARWLEQAGAIVEPMQPFMSQAMLDGMDHFWRMRSLIDMRALRPEQRAKVLPYIRQWAESASEFSGEHVFRGFSQFHATRVAAVAACARFDYVISPVSPNMPVAAELPSPTNDPLRPLEHIGFTVPFNMSEQPAASINCAYDVDGLPIGLQIAGQRFDDLGVLRVARAFE